MSDTPLLSALCARAEEGTLRMHMPGHKGAAVFPTGVTAESIDFTELRGTGNLCEPGEPFDSAAALYARDFGAKRAFLLAGGSTQGIYIMLLCAARRGKKLACDRACHKSVFYAMAYFGLEPEYITSGEGFGGTAGEIDICSARRALEAGASAIIVTSPTYYGLRRDLPALAGLAHSHGAMLLVDSAHGAHFPFCGLPSAVGEGADMAVCSIHKTLSALGGAALLTSSGAVPADEIFSAISQCGSSSPSYAILASADAARARAEAYDYPALISALNALKNRIPCNSLSGRRADPLRLTLNLGAAADEAAVLLESEGIFCELCDGENLVFIVTDSDTPESLARLEAALKRLKPGKRLQAVSLQPPVCALTPREAMLAPGETLPLGLCAGRVSAEVICRYPPGIPLCAPGELISRQTVELLGEQKPVRVVKE